MSFQERFRTIWVASIATPALFLALVPRQKRIDATAILTPQQEDELLIRSGTLLKKLSLGYDSLLADIYWTRAVQYYGNHVQLPQPEYESLYPLLDIATTLDPHLVIAHEFGALLLSEPLPVGAGRPDLAIELVRKGIAANPTDYRLPASLGFIYYWHLHDYQKSSDAYLAGSKYPGAPVWLKGMAARVAELGNSRETSVFIWSQLYQSSNEPSVRENALKHLQALKADQDLEQLKKLVAEYNHRFGHFPSSTQELVSAGMLRGAPLDPAGFPYVIRPGGDAGLSPQSTVSLDILSPIFPPRK
ncbi:MAG: hypothetical protein WBC04_01175 [Candidatus Acidiferrales bacterium]